MRVAIFHNLPSGGAKRSLHEWTRRLASRHELTLYTLAAADESYLDLRPLVDKVTLYAYAKPLHNRSLTLNGFLLRFSDLRRLRSLSERIAGEIDAADYDVVFVNHCQYTQAPYVLQYLRSSSVYYCQEPPRWLVEPAPPRPFPAFDTSVSPSSYRLARMVFDITFKRLLIKVDRYNTRRAGEILVNSHYSREVIYRTYSRFASFNRLGVDATRFRPLGTGKIPMVLSVGALAPVKGHDFVLQAVALIPANRRPEVVVVADRGSQAEKAYLQQLASRLDVRLTFHEAVSDEQLVAFYNRASLTACAAIMEPFGLVPLESMACRTPVVAVREGGLRESVLHGQTGLLAERDPEEFGEALDQLLQDEDKRHRLGDQGQAYVTEEWTWERSTDCLERNLCRLANHS
jgi:glycosyltransferase involved in cell wall biosynthesis